MSPFMLPPIRTDAGTGLRLLTIANRQRYSLALACLLATGSVATSGCVALSIPSKRFHDPQDHGGLFGDFRKGGSSGVPGHPVQLDGHFCDAFDEQDEFGTGGHAHPKAPEIPWPRYHPVPTRPVFSGYSGMQP